MRVCKRSISTTCSTFCKPKTALKVKFTKKIFAGGRQNLTIHVAAQNIVFYIFLNLNHSHVTVLQPKRYTWPIPDFSPSQSFWNCSSTFKNLLVFGQRPFILLLILLAFRTSFLGWITKLYAVLYFEGCHNVRTFSDFNSNLKE